MRFSGFILRAVTLICVVCPFSADSLIPSAKAIELKRAGQIAGTLQATPAPTPLLHQTRLPDNGSRQSNLVHRSDTMLARRWAMTKARLDVETEWLDSCALGACRDPRATTWYKTVGVVRAVSHKSRPALVQQLFSRNIKYIEDQAGDDHWASPLATLLRRAGDCEDHVLLKRAVLIAAGYREADTRLLILETASGRGHMALQVSGPTSLILDNRYRYPVTANRLQQDRIAAIASNRGYFVVPHSSSGPQSDT